jgi:putative chitinase
MARWTLTSLLRRAHFLAQVAHESAGFRATRENFNYSADRLRAVFFKYFDEPGEPEEFARQPERIANRVYAGRLGNGPESSGDGYRYHGRGLIQLTGKRNYRLYSKEAGVDVVANPDTIATSSARCADVAGWFWDRNGLHLWADRDDVLTVTKRINGGTHGLDDRKRFLRRAKQAFGI